MSDAVQPAPCPYVAQLVSMLLETDVASSGRDRPSMYIRLLDLEADARRGDASEATRQLIARVRRISGTAIVIPFPRRTEIGRREAGTLR